MRVCHAASIFALLQFRVSLCNNISVMYISSVKMHNFRGYLGDREIRLCQGVNYFVGNNNCGKTTIFRAIEFLCSGGERDDVITKSCIKNSHEYVSVEVELSGSDISKILNGNSSLKKYANYVSNNGGRETILVKRSSLEEAITQSGKSKTIDIKKVLVYNPESNQFENPVGIDKTIGALFDTQFVWADMDSTGVADFSKTKICGRILSAILSGNLPDSWSEFEKMHRTVFDEVREKLEPVESAVNQKMLEQYGPVDVKFNFTLPDIANFLKNGSIAMTDGGYMTDSVEKGTGMQRALALALIQVYAGMQKEKNVEKPIFFFFDEPETFLHPKAQDKLLSSIVNLSKDSQVFIATHSPYLLRAYKKGRDCLYVFSRVADNIEYKRDNDIGLFGAISPTTPEINYIAFDVVSPEFHDELYGFIQARAVDVDDKYEKEKEFDNFLQSMGAAKSKKWSRLQGGEQQSAYDVTLQTYIRNFIHHPENTCNDGYTEDELRKSTSDMIEWFGKLNMPDGGYAESENERS